MDTRVQPRENDFRRLFEPRAIAVAGASARSVSAGNRFIRLLEKSGYAGAVYPLHPSAEAIEGYKAYRDFASLPEVVDYAYLTVPAERVPEVLANGAEHVGFVQVMASSPPSEAEAWEEHLLYLARECGFRLIGPNCMGTHSPRGRFTFMEDVHTEVGGVGIGCQSGGLGMDILRRGQNVGLRFSGLVTLGNSIDVGPADLLNFYLQDPDTRVIGFYVEDLKDGRRFQELARRNRGDKPVVVLVGGLTGLGREAAASHTGALGGSRQAWEALARQTGIILAWTLDGFLDTLQVCQWLSPHDAPREPSVTLFGNGGGTSVLATDALDRSGLTLASPGPEARQAYDAIELPPGASLRNPIDLPASVLKEESRIAERILKIDRELTRPWATIVHLNLPVIAGYRHVSNFLPNLVGSVFGPAGKTVCGHHVVLVLRSDRSAELEEWRRIFRAAAVERGVPTFDEVPEAVAALASFRAYEQVRARMMAGDAHETKAVSI